jgi:hypothetical protein
MTAPVDSDQVTRLGSQGLGGPDVLGRAKARTGSGDGTGPEPGPERFAVGLRRPDLIVDACTKTGSSSGNGSWRSRVVASGARRRLRHGTRTELRWSVH